MTRKTTDSLNLVGSGLRRNDAVDKITGRARYLDDLHFDRMLYARMVVSEIPHGMLKKLDTRPALKIPGVVRVATAADVPGINQVGCVVEDQPLFAVDKVRYIGEPLAVVVAETPEAALAGARAVKVKIEPLPGIFDPKEAFDDTKNLIHQGGNMNCHFPIRRGNWQNPLAGADVIIEDEYFVHHQEQMYMESQGCIALPPDAGGSLTIYGSMQCPFYVQKAVSKVMGLPFSKIRAIQTVLGGAFGGKEDIPNEFCAKAALLAVMTDRPVKLVLDREDDIKMTSKRHAMRLKYRAGFKKNGKMTGIEVTGWGDSGGYITLSTVVLWRSSVHAAGPYVVPNVKVDIYGCYTNHVPSGAFRGFGSPQVIFGSETLMDKAAAALGIDPIELRLKNALQPGTKTITGHKVQSCGFVETLEAARKASQWDRKRAAFDKHNSKPGRTFKGLGIGSCYYGMTLGAKGWSFDKAAAHVMVLRDGSVQLAVGNTDMGQGSTTVLAQLLAETLGCQYENIHVLPVDTALVPDSGPTVASRTTVMSGNALLDAARPIIVLMRSVAAEMLGCAPGKIVVKGGWFSRNEAGRKKRVSFADVAGTAYMKNVVLGSLGSWHVPPLKYDIEQGLGEAYFEYCFAAHVAEVEIDRETGVVRLVHGWCAHDSGRVVNQTTYEGQVEGGFLQGAGWTLMENVALREGRMLADNFTTYIIPSALDATKVTVIPIETMSDHGPYGAKGLGEISMMPAPAAVARAIGHVLGEGPHELPVLPEMILAQLKRRGGK